MSNSYERIARENRALRARIRRLTARRKIEFSKCIFVGVSIVTLAITVFACILAWRTQDTSVLCYLIPAVFAEMASATGFYYSKAKAENQIKLSALRDVKPEENHSNEIGG